MAGEIDFRHYRNTAGGRVFYDVPDLVLGVEPAVAYAVVAFPVAAHHSAVTPGTDLGETGILVYLYSPALVFGEVPVEAVELIDGHHVQHLLHLLDAEEMPAAVEHQAAVAEPRRIGNFAAGKLALRTGSDRKHLANGLQRIEEAAKAACAHLCVFPSDADRISLRGHRSIHDKGHSFPLSCRAGPAAQERKLLRKTAHGSGTGGIHRRVAIKIDSPHVKEPALHLHALRGRDDVQLRNILGASAKHRQEGGGKKRFLHTVT